MIYIYKLYFEHEPNVCYIGQTKDIKKRFQQHKWALNHTQKRYVSDWIVENGVDNLNISVLDSCEINPTLKESEQIAKHLKMGFTLINKNSGGCGKKKKRVGKFSLEGELLDEFDSIKSASISLNKAHTAILRVCAGNDKLKTAYGFIWKYLD